MNRAMREPSAGVAGSERTKISKPSQILSQEENELIFTLLGRKCQVRVNCFYSYLFHLTNI